MMPWTYLGPSASEIAASLPGSSRNPSSRGWWSLRGICHGSGDKRGSTSLSISEKPHGKGIAVFCFRGCDRQTIIAALEYATGRRVEDAWTRDPHAPHGISVQRRRPSTTTSTPAQGDGQAQDMTALARRIWSAASAIPSDAGHPARLWMAARRLWRPDVPAPSALRWLDFSKGTPRPGGAIVACYAPLEAWRPSPPTPTAIECIYIDGDGQPTLDRPEERGGRPKRHYGTRRGAGSIIGEADLSGSIGVVEGIADALAVASRWPGPVLVCAGTSGLRDDALADALASAAEVFIFADNDKDEAGLAAAHHLRESLRLRGATAYVLMNNRVKDPAEASARGDDFPYIDPHLLEDEAERLRSEGHGQDAVRRAAILLS